jgi:hypothetical protein
LTSETNKTLRKHQRLFTRPGAQKSAARIKQVAKPCVKQFAERISGEENKKLLNTWVAKSHKKSAPKSA